MRILSQDGIGTIDLPYEQVGIGVNAHDNKEIISYPIISLHEDDYWVMARYSTESKTKRAMEMLRKAYSPILVVKEQENGIETNIKPNNWIVGTIAPAPKIEVYDNFYFQFPSDEELED